MQKEQTEIKLYNTAERKIVNFKPIEKGKIGLYVCGPTVYGPAHIGHARTYVAFDIIKRYLKYRCFKVRHIVNITDIHDDIMKKAREQNTTIFKLADQNIKLFFKDMDALGVERADVYPRVTEHIKEIIELIQTLEKKGYAYETEDGVYFKVSKFKDYGKLSGIKLQKSKTGTRVDTDKYDKEAAMDFALWKKAKLNEPFWESPWGKGRPGWHIECSVMSMKNLGQTLDIHGGAKDLIFPHHENEIAQSEAATGKQFVNYWLHTGLLTIENEKMSKSMGNFIIIPDLLAQYDAKAFRFFIAGMHYRSEIDFSEDSMQKTKAALEKINNFIQTLHEISAEGKDSKEVSGLIALARSQFISGMDNDFNTPKAMAGIFDFVRETNRLISEKKLTKKDAEKALSFMKELDSVFNVFDFRHKKAELPSDVAELARQREEARKKKDFKRSDELRNLILEKGYLVNDTPEGQKIRKK